MRKVYGKGTDKGRKRGDITPKYNLFLSHMILTGDPDMFQAIQQKGRRAKDAEEMHRMENPVPALNELRHRKQQSV